MTIITHNLYQEDVHVERVVIMVPTLYYFHGEVRHYFDGLLKEASWLDDQTRFRILMIIDELATNAIEFGSQKGDEIAVTLYMKVQKWIEVVVEDSGNGLIPKNAQEMNRILAEKKEEQNTQTLPLRGRGLAKIILPWVDEIQFLDKSPRGLLVRARIYVV